MATTEVFQDWDRGDISSIRKTTTRTSTKTTTRREIYGDSDDEVREPRVCWCITRVWGGDGKYVGEAVIGSFRVVVPANSQTGSLISWGAQGGMDS